MKVPTIGSTFVRILAALYELAEKAQPRRQ